MLRMRAGRNLSDSQVQAIVTSNVTGEQKFTKEGVLDFLNNAELSGRLMVELGRQEGDQPLSAAAAADPPRKFRLDTRWRRR